MLIAQILAPAPERSLSEAIGRVRRSFPGDHRGLLRELLRTGELEKQTIDGVGYVAPTFNATEEEAQRTVRFLAPFDPLVWDRRRFEHLWGWAYRFEAYVPAARRVRGYYALPLLWGDAMIGWANAADVNGSLQVELGFVDKRPSGRDFRSALDAELASMETFLHLNRGLSR
jgi:hypothetical protein